MSKVIGNGMIAKAFLAKKYELNNCIIFASGVSNSRCDEQKEFIREKILLEKEIKGIKEIRQITKLIYFSTCSIYDQDTNSSEYVKHKLHMESIVLKYPNNIVFRLPQIAGPNAPSNTILSNIKEKINSGKIFPIWKNASRNVLDLFDARDIVVNVTRRNHKRLKIVNVANPSSYSVHQIVSSFEKVYNLKMNKKYVDKGNKYSIDISNIEYLFNELSIDFSNYLDKIIRKYYI